MCYVIPVSVLCIEDNSGVAEVIKQLLIYSKARLKYRNVPTLKIALRELKKHKFDIILLDLKLPDSVGTDTYRAIAEATDLPVIVITGTASEEERQKILEMGAKDCIRKDEITSDNLWRAIRYVLIEKLHEEEIANVMKEIKEIKEHVRLAFAKIHAVTDRLDNIMLPFSSNDDATQK